MKQQVNFVSFLPAQTQDALSFATLVILSLIFLIVLIVAYVASYWQVDQLKKQLSEMRVQQVSTSNAASHGEAKPRASRPR
jgi:protein-S-isoprenylcysteine O-methyltransferase Ste14